LLVVPAELPVHNVSELMAYLQQHPGRVSYASAGEGTVPHLAAELFRLQANAPLPGIAYAGAAPAISSTVRGDTQLMFPSLFTAQPYLRSGKLRALAVAQATRLPSLPNVPTLAETGIGGIEVTQWYALFAPATTPAHVVTQLNQALNTVLQDGEIVSRMEADGANVQTSTPLQLKALLASERLKWQTVVQHARLHLDHATIEA
jgi:tripartite-type tricarboxylate transporter receptor subunit TctC